MGEGKPHMQESEGSLLLPRMGKWTQIDERDECETRTMAAAEEKTECSWARPGKDFWKWPQKREQQRQKLPSRQVVTIQLKTSAKKKMPSKGTERKLQDAKKDLWLLSDRALRSRRFKKLNHVNSNRNNKLILTQVNALNRHFPNYKLASSPGCQGHPQICAYISTHRHRNKNNKSFLKN